MSTRNTYQTGGIPFVVDQGSLHRNGGRQIDWANVSDTYKDAVSGKKKLPAGTVVGDTLGSGKVSPRVVSTNPAIGILETNAVEDEQSAAITGYGILKAGVLFENLLPDATGTGYDDRTLASGIKTELATAGCFFTFEHYGDDSFVS